jgi:hypothetical protein
VAGALDALAKSAASLSGAVSAAGNAVGSSTLSAVSIVISPIGACK